MNAISYPEPVIVDLPEKPDTSTVLSEFQDAAIAVVPMLKMQRIYARYVLARCDGNITHAARHLGVNRRTLQRWARKDANR